MRSIFEAQVPDRQHSCGASVPGRRVGPLAPGEAFDVQALCDIVGDEPAVMVEIVACFEEVAVGTRARLLRAAANGDAAEAAMLAHTLKSSSRSVGALPLGALCALLEAEGGAGRVGRAVALVAEVVEALDVALAAMRRWRMGHASPVPLQKMGYGS